MSSTRRIREQGKGKEQLQTTDFSDLRRLLLRASFPAEKSLAAKKSWAVKPLPRGQNLTNKFSIFPPSPPFSHAS